SGVAATMMKGELSMVSEKIFGDLWVVEGAAETMVAATFSKPWAAWVWPKISSGLKPRTLRCCSLEDLEVAVAPAPCASDSILAGKGWVMSEVMMSESGLAGEAFSPTSKLVGAVWKVLTALAGEAFSPTSKLVGAVWKVLTALAGEAF